MICPYCEKSIIRSCLTGEDHYYFSNFKKKEILFLYPGTKNKYTFVKHSEGTFIRHKQFEMRIENISFCKEQIKKILSKIDLLKAFI